MPPQPPDYGVGPANVTNPGEVSPFAGFDNLIRYQDMARYQMVSQYQQGMIRPAAMTLAQQRRVATEARFQYGVQGGQENTARFYQRQAESRQRAFGAAVTLGAVDFGIFEAASAAAISVGAKGIMRTVALPSLAVMPLAMGIGWGVKNSIKRQQFMQSMASDVEQYRDQLGFSGDLTYGRASMLGASLESTMESRKGGFFSKDQMARIHKIGLSNNMLTATSRGAGSGSLKQYETNVKELIDTTESVVKILQTTIEGGMSVIKELNQTGIKDLGKIKQWVAQSKAIGAMTGLGSQNIMQIGAAGAQAAQGTPYSAATGASAYQMGAVSAQGITQAARGAAAVDRVGGVAGAAAVIGNFGMNVLSSGMGSRAIAYMMDPSTGRIDRTKANTLLSGGVSAYGIMTGSSAVGHALGPSGRYMFETNKADIINNQMSAKDRQMAVLSVYEAWSRNKPYISQEAKRLKFATDFSGSASEAAVIAESLKAGTNYAVLNATQAVEMRAADPLRSRMAWGPTARTAQGAWGAGKDVFNYIGGGIYSAGANLGGLSARVARGIGESIAGGANILGIATGIYDKYGGREAGDFGDIRANLEVAYGLRNKGSLGDLGRQLLLTGERTGASVKKFGESKIKFDADAIIANALKTKGGIGDLNKMTQDAIQAIVTGKIDEFTKNASNMRIIGGPGIGRTTLGVGLNGMPMYNYNPDGASSWRKQDLGSPDLIALTNSLKAKKISLTAEKEMLDQKIADERKGLTSKADRDAYDAKYDDMSIDMRFGRLKKDPKDLRTRALFLDEKLRNFAGLDIIDTPIVNVQSAEAALGAAVGTAAGPRGAKGLLNKTLAFMSKQDMGIFGGRGVSSADIDTPLARYMKSKGISLKQTGGRFSLDTMEQVGTQLMALKETVISGAPTAAELSAFDAIGKKTINEIISKTKDLGVYDEINRRYNLIPSVTAEAGKFTKGSKAGFEEGLRGIFGITATKEDAKEDAKKFISTYSQNLKSAFGMAPSEMSSILQKEGVATLASRLSNKATEKTQITDEAQLMTLAMKSIDKLRAAKEGEEIKDILLPNRTIGEVKSSKVKETLEEMKGLKEIYSQMHLAKLLREGGEGGGLSAGVRSPVLNYWNNRWVL